MSAPQFLDQRVHDAAVDLCRYGGEPFSAEICDALDVLVQLNTSMCRGRDFAESIAVTAEEAKAAIDAAVRGYCDDIGLEP